MDQIRESENSHVNIAKIMIPKISIALLHSDDTVRQGLELLRRKGYTAVPVLDERGTYLGSVTEGDFLRHMLAVGSTDLKEHENYKISEIFRRNFCKPLQIYAPLQELIDTALEQNFVPIVDDRNCLCGIVTRRSIILYLAELSGKKM